MPLENDGATSEPVSQEDLDLLSEDAEDEVKKDDEKSEETPPEDEKIDEEEKEEEEEVSEEDEDTERIDDETPPEEETEGKLPSFKKINEKYPNFLKEFPEVRVALGRELEYKNLFPTVESAKDAHERVAFHRELEEDILEGKSGLLLTRLHQTDEKALNKFAKNFLPTLLKGNPELYERITLPIVKNVLRAAIKEGERHGNKQLPLAAKYISQFVFDSSDIPEDEKEEKEDKEPSESDRKLQKLLTQRVIDFKQELQESTQNILEHTVKSTIDPDEVFPKSLRNSLMKDILAEVADTLGEDKEHTSKMSALWNQARSDDFSRQNLSQLKSAYLARAKKILPAIQKKHVNEALKEMGRKPKEDVRDSKHRKFGPTDKDKKSGRFAKGWSNDPKKLDPSKTDAQLLGED